MMHRSTVSRVVLELTSRCNQECLYCYNIWKREGASPPEPLRPEDEYLTARRTLKTLFRQARPGRITMSGGEPLVAHRFMELVLFCRMHRAGVTVISNGTGAAAQEYRQLVELGVDLFEFTIHSDRATEHDTLTGIPGSWHRATTVACEVAGLTQVVGVVVLTRINVGRLADTLRFMASLGIRRVMVNRFNIGGAGLVHAEALLLDTDELRGALRTAAKVAGDTGLRVSSNVCTPWCVVDPREFPGISMGSCGTSPERMPLTLTAGGDLRLCNHSPVVLGNIHERHIDELLSGPAVSRFFTTEPRYCAACNDYDGCRGGCRSVSEQLGIPIDEHDPVRTSVRT